jgi:hypothetical protein
MPKGRRLRDVGTYKRLMTCNKLIGLCKSQPLDRCVDCCTILTQEPSFPISWGQIQSLLVLLTKVADGTPLNKNDKKYLRGHMSVFASVWHYMTTESPQKGIINAAMAPRPERADGEGPDDSTDPGIITP